VADCYSFFVFIAIAAAVFFFAEFEASPPLFFLSSLCSATEQLDSVARVKRISDARRHHLFVSVLSMRLSVSFSCPLTEYAEQ